MQKAELTRLAKELELPEERVIDESIAVFLDRELRDASAEILRIKAQFNAASPTDLKSRIEAGKVQEHPAWEQLIYWENLDKRMKVVSHWMQKLHISG